MVVRGLIGAALAVYFATGCSQASVATRTASEELGCSESALSVQELESDRYRVRGCGESRIYYCPGDGECMREGFHVRSARERASREFGCAHAQIEVRWIQDETYRVEACGQAATYDCEGGECRPEGPHPTEPVVVPVIVH